VIDSWKGIAAHLGRDVSTVMRWERSRGLPVHRLPGGRKATVYALAAFDWLDRAIDARDPHVLHLPVKPHYDSLRQDARLER
jgi:hypothetical protein